jgi:hypothetical protein
MTAKSENGAPKFVLGCLNSLHAMLADTSPALVEEMGRTLNPIKEGEKQIAQLDADLTAFCTVLSAYRARARTFETELDNVEKLDSISERERTFKEVTGRMSEHLTLLKFWQDLFWQEVDHRFPETKETKVRYIRQGFVIVSAPEEHQHGHRPHIHVLELLIPRE